MKRHILFLGTLLVLASCEKVIEVDLNSADPQKVIEAVLAEGQDSLLISITETSDYFNSEPQPKVSGAAVALSNSKGHRLTGTEVSPGLYLIDGITTEIGETYNLEVAFGTEVTTASSYLPPVVPIDSVYFEYFEQTTFFDEGFRPYFAFQDPPGVENYYKLELTINGKPNNGSIEVFDDEFVDGAYLNYGFFGEILDSGDVVQVELKSIDRDVYMYYSTLSEIDGSGGQPGIAPGNPVTNLIGPIKLGYFGTYSSDIKSRSFP